ncbi:MAG TPA: lipoyl synthase [Vicinamibacteria bacterium]|nr:lipoyl synthase [Vicinamibacteria bacterium]
MGTTDRTARPDWLKVRLPSGENYFRLKGILRGLSLNTVCEEARCPNVAECWGQGTATFMILGDTCTRACGFCAVKTGLPQFLDREEPARVAEAVSAMGLDHAVVTSVNRDELPDGGASIFAATIEAIRRRRPTTTVEVLIPDFKGSRESLETVLSAGPDILNHNVETVPRLYKRVRPGANFLQSVELLRRVKEIAPGAMSKTGMMLGLGEETEEVEAVMRHLVSDASVDILTLGQYLQPTAEHLAVVRFVHPDEFRRLAASGTQMGFRHVEAGPLVRSSYHASSQVPA